MAYLCVAKNTVTGAYFKREFEYDDYATTDINDALIEVESERPTHDNPAEILDTVADYVDECELDNWQAVRVTISEAAWLQGNG